MSNVQTMSLVERILKDLGSCISRVWQSHKPKVKDIGSSDLVSAAHRGQSSDWVGLGSKFHAEACHGAGKKEQVLTTLRICGRFCACLHKWFWQSSMISFIVIGYKVLEKERDRRFNCECCLIYPNSVAMSKHHIYSFFLFFSFPFVLQNPTLKSSLYC